MIVAWLTGRPKALGAVRKVLGRADYEAHAGAYSGGTNAVYWLELIEKQSDGTLIVTNITEGQKRDIIKVPLASLEPDLVYPLLRGRDVQRWVAQPCAWILMAQDPEKRRGIDEKNMQINYPKTWTYLKQFEASLRQRKARGVSDMVEKGVPFCTMFAISGYTFAPYKVVWREQAASLTASVVGSYQGKPIIPDHKLMLIDRMFNCERITLPLCHA